MRAEALARRGEHAAAIELARAAVEIAAATDALLDHADARLALAAALRAAGRGAEADAEEQRAIELWEAKGATLLAERATGQAPRAAEPTARSDGRSRRTESLDIGREGNAPARFDELGAAAVEPRFANAAFRAAQRSNRLISERNWDGLVATRAPGWEQDDRRAIVGVKISEAEIDSNLRMFFDARWVRFDDTLLATRGDRLALRRTLLRGQFGSSGPVEYEYLALGEIDEAGRSTGLVMFDPFDLDAAYAELDARYHAGEAAPHAAAAAAMRAFHGAFAARDWDALGARCAPDVAIHDHRRLGWEALHGRAAYLGALRSLVELAPDTRLRLDHVELDAGRYLVITVWEGTRDGGRFEEPSWMVAEPLPRGARAPLRPVRPRAPRPGAGALRGDRRRRAEAAAVSKLLIRQCTWSAWSGFGRTRRRTPSSPRLRGDLLERQESCVRGPRDFPLDGRIVRVRAGGARTLSFKRAAAELHVSPSALSRRIQSLEDHLGTPLFRRLNPGLELTEVGARYREGVELALDRLEVAQRESCSGRARRASA